MLVLARMKDQALVFNVPPSDKPTRVTVTVCDIRGDKVRLGSDAPVEVTIHRKEIQDGIDANAERIAGELAALKAGKEKAAP